jgi:hypothetical protein
VVLVLPLCRGCLWQLQRCLQRSNQLCCFSQIWLQPKGLLGIEKGVVQLPCLPPQPCSSQASLRQPAAGGRTAAAAAAAAAGTGCLLQRPDICASFL